MNISPDEATTFDATLQFENKKLVRLALSAEVSEVPYSLTMRLYDYGTTKNEFPNV